MEEKRTHRYEVRVSDEWVIRWCPVCGQSWLLVKSMLDSVYRWIEIEERERQQGQRNV